MPQKKASQFVREEKAPSVRLWPESSRWLRRGLALTLSCGLLLTTTWAQEPSVSKISWQGLQAFRLSDGKVEAIVVPERSGRVMSFRRVGEKAIEWLWQAPEETLRGNGYKNWGGDKTFLGPQSDWQLFGKPGWPPDPSWDGPAHEATLTADGHLRTRGAPSAGSQICLEREFWFEGGEFVVRQTFEKVGGEPRLHAIWDVTQIATPEAVFLPLNPASLYQAGYYSYSAKLPPNANLETLSPSVLKIGPAPGASYKVGVDSPVAALLAVRGQEAFRVRAALEKGPYPEGAERAGFPVEFYNHADAGPAHYVELELLSPLHLFRSTDRYSFTVRWTLHSFPVDVPTAESAEKLLREPLR